MSTLKTNTLSNVAGTASTAIENAINGSAKAWVNFNGTGTVAIRASYNVSSITDNGVGDYTVNMTNALTDTNYCAIGHITQTAVTTEVVTWAARVIDVSTSAVRMRCGLQGATSGSAADNEFVRLVVFR